MRKLLHFAILIALALGAASPALAQGIGLIAPGHVLGNPSAVTRTPTDAALITVMDQALCTTVGAVPVRGAGGWTCNIPIYNISGTAAAPSYSFSASNTDGMYLVGAGTLGFTTSGVLRLQMNASALSISGAGTVLNNNSGTAAAPSYTFSASNSDGMYLGAVGELDFTTAGVKRIALNASALTISGTTSIYNQSGTAAAPAYSFAASTNDGLYLVSVGLLGWTTSGVQSATLSSGVFNVVTGFKIAGAAASGNVLRGNGTNFVSAQLSFSDLSGSESCSQHPALTGDVTTSAGSCATTVAKIQGTTVSGTTGNTNVVFSVSAVFSSATITSSTLDGSTLGGTNTNLLHFPGTQFVDHADTTKKVGLVLSGITTGNTRNWTFQDSSDTFVGRATTDTLTNKTLTSPTITNQSSSGTSTSITNVGTFALRDASAAFDLTIAANSVSAALTAARTLTFDVGNVAHTIKYGTTAGTITFPNTAADTVAMLGIANTFTADQTINSGVGGNGQLRLTNSSDSVLLQMDGPTHIIQFGEVGGGGTFKTVTNGTLAFGTNNVFQMTLQASGGLSIGTATDPGVGSLQLNAQAFMPNITTSSAAQTGTVCWTTGTGKFTADTTLGCLASSKRWKKEIRQFVASVDELMELRPVLFQWKEPIGFNQVGDQFGLVAEDVYSVDPRLAGLGSDNLPRAWRQDAMIAFLVSVVQQQQRDLNQLKAKH